MCQALAKRKSALHKSELANAALREALLNARLCHSQAQNAKHVLDAANIYIGHVQWTVQQSKHKSVLSNREYRVTTVTNPGVYGTHLFNYFCEMSTTIMRRIVNHIVNIPGTSTSMAIILD